MRNFTKQLFFSFIAINITYCVNAQNLAGFATGGGNLSNGALFKFDAGSSSYTDLHDFGGSPDGAQAQFAPVIASNCKWYGVTRVGGTFNAGTLFEYDPSTSTYTKKVDFDGSNGLHPGCELKELSPGILYGTAAEGGTNGVGTIYKYDINSATLTKLFNMNNSGGTQPIGNLILFNSKLYGICLTGGSNNEGSIFEFDPEGSGTFTKKSDFSNSNGFYPLGGMELGADNKLYGSTQYGGANNAGTLYQFDPTSSVFTKKVDLSNSTGNLGIGQMCLASNNKLYGITNQGGANGFGALFEYDPSGNTYTKKADFSTSNGKNPGGGLLYASDGNIYGMNQSGGTNGVGVIYKYDISADALTPLYSFSSTNGSNPQFGKLIEIICPGGPVGGGGGGGLESKDLGSAVVQRVYNKAITNQNGAVNYNKLSIVGASRTAAPVTFGTVNISNIKLSDMMPDITNRGFVAYNSTPLDITSITNAKEVIATDFTVNQQPKAVAFATMTLGALYDHTKPICDRLKGASLLNVADLKVGGYDFVQYTLKDENGVTEYATSFSVGTKSGRNTFSVQSTWLLKDYTSEDVMYNFQLWASTPQLVNAMITDVLNKIQTVAPVASIAAINVPATYIVSGSRTGENLNLVLTNGTANTSGYFTLQDQSTELSTSTASRQIPFTLNANGQSTVSIPMNDMYESTISMYVNGKMTDVVYMADGTWAVDYNQATTTVNNFTISNNANRTYDANEYPLLRNATVTGNSSDFISVIKLLRGGAAPADLSAFKTLQLTASGGYTLRVTLVKNSITNWADQYYTEIKLDNNQKDYYVSLDNFISSASKDKINANDVTTVVFAIQVGTTNSSAVNTTLSNISFTKLEANYLNSLNSKEIQLYPNPSTAKNFNCSFYSNVDAQQLTLRVTDAMGITIATQQVNAVKGLNIVPVTINSNTNGIHFITLDGTGVKYNSKKMLLTSQ